MSDTKQIVSRWTYIGRRITTDQKIGYAWLMHEGETGVFRKLKGTVVGGVYEVANGKEDGSRVVFGSPVFVEQVDDSRAIGEWQLEDRTAQIRKAAMDVERKAADVDHLGSMTLDQVKEMMRGSPAPRRAGIVAAAIRYIGGGW